MPIVSLEKCNSYTQKEVDSAVGNLIENLGGIQKFAMKGQKILIKPNIVKGMSPSECGTTNPAVIESVIKILKQNSCSVLVGDCPFSDDAVNAMKISGIYDVCKKHDAKIALFDKRVEYKNNDAMVVKNFQLTSYFNEIDAIINIPKLKTHSQLYFTGAVKNLYSFMPGPRRGFYHLKHSNIEHFANMLLDLYALVREKVVLNIFDGVYGMEGNGPIHGNPKFAGILGASRDAVALDYFMCKLIGLDMKNLPTVYYARKRKDFMFDESKIKLAGEKTENIKIEKFKEAEFRTLSMMPKFANKFKDYITMHSNELVY